MGYFITFLLHLIFWEFIFIGIPVIIAIAAVYLLWWKKLPDTERKEYREGHLFGKRSRRSDAGGGISFLVFIVFMIKVYLDGNWGLHFAEWSFDYLVYSYLWAFIWVAIIFGIPILIGATWWIRHEMKK
jgi:di/tricarboxylate transporter